MAVGNRAVTTWEIRNGHGDIVGTTDAVAAYTANPTTDEFGIGTVPSNRLGYLGGQERFTTDATLGIIRMGVRLYDPTLGRFLQTDPIRGGSANNYDYALQDPLNHLDLAGTDVPGTWMNLYSEPIPNRYDLVYSGLNIPSPMATTTTSNPKNFDLKDVSDKTGGPEAPYSYGSVNGVSYIQAAIEITAYDGSFTITLETSPGTMTQQSTLDPTSGRGNVAFSLDGDFVSATMTYTEGTGRGNAPIIYTVHLTRQGPSSLSG